MALWDGLIADFTFDESASPFADSVGGRQLTGSVTSIAGHSGNAIRSASSSVDLIQSAGSQLPGTFTAAWLIRRSSDTGSNVTPVVIGRHTFLLDLTGHVRLSESDGGSLTAWSTAAIPLNTWSLVAFSVDVSERKAYIDAVEACAGSVFNFPADGSITRFGRGAATNVIDSDRLLVWNRVLSAAEHEQLRAQLFAETLPAALMVASVPAVTLAGAESLPAASLIATVPAVWQPPLELAAASLVATVPAVTLTGAESLPAAPMIATVPAVTPPSTVPAASLVASVPDLSRTGAESVETASLIATVPALSRTGADSLPAAALFVAIASIPYAGQPPALLRWTDESLITDGYWSDEWLQSAA